MYRPLVLGAVLLVGCQSRTRDTSDSADINFAPVAAAAEGVVILSAGGENLGTLRLERHGDGSRLVGALRGVPAGRHGIHVHAIGRCDAPTFGSAGGHFNPHGKQHGLENPAGPHAGDAPNIVADSAGSATVDLLLPHVAWDTTGTSVLGDADAAAVVVHARADDQKTDPSGNSGDRIACGVLSAARGR